MLVATSDGNPVASTPHIRVGVIELLVMAGLEHHGLTNAGTGLTPCGPDPYLTYQTFGMVVDPGSAE